MKKQLISSTHRVAYHSELLQGMKTIEATLLEAGASTGDYTILDLLNAGLKLVEIEAIKDLAKHLEDSATVPLGKHIGKITNILENWE